MNRKLGLILSMGILYTLFVCTTASAANYHVFVIDNSASMAETEYNAENTRLQAAVAMAVSMVPNGMTNYVKVVSMTHWDPTDPDSNDSKGELLTPDWIQAYNASGVQVKETIQGVADTMAAWTALAEAICLGADQLVSLEGDNKYLHVFTDGFENNSHDLLTDCFGSLSTIDFNVNTHTPFNQDEIDSYPEESRYLVNRYWEESNYVAGDDDRSAWVTGNDNLWGRSYFHSGDILDWSGGVSPDTWQWKVYQQVARGYVPGDAMNPEWDGNPDQEDGGAYDGLYGQQRVNDIVLNVNAFYNEIVDESSSSSMTSSMTASPSLFVMAAPLSEKDASAVAPRALASVVTLSSTSVATTSASSPSLPYPDDDMYSYDYTFLTGMAQLTNGRVIDMVDNSGKIIPLAGDLNSDGAIDETDLRIVLTWFARPVDRYNPQSSLADIDQTLFVDNADVAMIRANWTDESKPAPILGDIDYNWVVDQADLTQVMQWYGQPVNPGAQHSYHADMNADGFIDDLDVAIVLDAINNPAPTCSDNAQNGDETDVDCGGSTCIACAEGKSCLINSDCQSDNCDPTTYTCDLPVGFDVVATISVNNDWGAGYCATLDVTNYAAAATTSWSVILDTAGGAFFSTWNANFTSSAGDVYVTPVGWNAAIQSGQTINSVGFCANRNGSTGTAMVVDANGTY